MRGARVVGPARRFLFFYDRPGRRSAAATGPARRRLRPTRPAPPRIRRRRQRPRDPRRPSPRSSVDAAAEPRRRASRLVSFVDGEDGYCVLALGERTAPRRSAGRRTGAIGRASPNRPSRAARVLDTETAASSRSPGARPARCSSSAIGERGHRARTRSRRADQRGELDLGPGVAWELPAERLRRAADDLGGDRRRATCAPDRARPEGAASHEEEMIGAARLIPGAEPYGYVEPLLSTEYDGAGSHVRATLELWAGADEHLPERGGGLRVGGGVTRRPRRPARGGPLRLEARRLAGGRRLRDPDRSQRPGRAAQCRPCRSAPSSVTSAACSPRRCWVPSPPSRTSPASAWSSSGAAMVAGADRARRQASRCSSSSAGGSPRSASST